MAEATTDSEVSYDGNVAMDLVSVETGPAVRPARVIRVDSAHAHALVPPSFDAEALKRCACEIASRRPEAGYPCSESYVNLCVVSPGAALVVWRMQPGWAEDAAAQKGERWQGSRPVIRLYDVSLIRFNGFNAHRMRDIVIDGMSGERLLAVPLAGTSQIAEVGFLLRSGEFVPASRSATVAFPSGTVSPNHDYSALYVDDRLIPEPLASPWEGKSFLRERSRPKLRRDLRIAVLSFEAEAAGHRTPVASFVGALAAELAGQGLEVHAFVPANRAFDADAQLGGVAYHALTLGDASSPVDAALAFARSLEDRLRSLPSFDHFHMQEWMTALLPWLGTRPATLALSSIERVRRDGSAPSELSQQIEKLEHEAARSAECLIVPAWLRDRVVTELGTDGGRVHAFPMDGRPVDEWEAPLDLGAVKARLGLGPSDRMLLFVGPLEWAAGPDLLVEALTTVVARANNARMVFVGCGSQHGHLLHRAQQLGVGHAVRLLGHLELPQLVPILRASEGLLLPSRSRVANDHAVVGLARRAGRPVLTTQGGPAYLVHHEENGLVVYDNPPSLVWGMSRLLEDRRHADDMGRNGFQPGDGASWTTVARSYADLCAASFPELREPANPPAPAERRVA